MLSSASRFRRRLVVNLALLTCSAGLAILLGEGLARLFLDPGEYLAPKLVPDDSLGQRIEPFSTGHDAWGFRNQEVPEKADIVVIGDSQTYGNNAPASQAWPVALEKQISRKVYSMALGGYGPVEYGHLLRTKAMRLNPSVVIVGFYYGNDLWGAFHSAPADLKIAVMRQLGWSKGAMDSTLNLPSISVFEAATRQGYRSWMAQHCVIYRLFKFHLAEGLRTWR